MSKTKEFICNLEEDGIDVLNIDNSDADYEDYEYQKLLEDSYRWSIEKLNEQMASTTNPFNIWK